MAREFTRNMFIMLVAIMVGVGIITYFAADVINRSKIETLTTQHIVEIEDINSKNENFTNYYLQGSIKMDSAREVREVGNYYFDFALFWFNNALRNITERFIHQCIDNCTQAMTTYLSSHLKFGEARPYFEKARNFTTNPHYIEVLGYYVGFSQSGKNITLLRYNASKFLKEAAENLSLGDIGNYSLLLEKFNTTEDQYLEQAVGYNNFKDQIDQITFFNPVRETP